MAEGERNLEERHKKAAAATNNLNISDNSESDGSTLQTKMMTFNL
jgi:hypothetical protein